MPSIDMPLDLMPFAAQGVCVLSVDTRGQNGQSQDAAVYPEGHQMGWMTQGIRDPQSCFYRYVYADAARALELLARRGEVDAQRRAIEVAQAGPYLEIPAFLKSFQDLQETVIRTLSYYDNMNLAPWIRCRMLVSNGLWDDICPPSTIFAVYNHTAAEKQMEIYPFHKHEVPYEHRETQFRVMMEALRP